MLHEKGIAAAMLFLDIIDLPLIPQSLRDSPQGHG